jgi:tRNA modification GTPase
MSRGDGSSTSACWLFDPRFMDFRLDDTIGALASAPGPAGRSIIRISGPDVLPSVERFFEPLDEPRWRSVRVAAAFEGFVTPAALRGRVPVVIYRWPCGHSYTGQSLVEIHAPGSPPLLEAVLASLFENGIRAAGPGEFTARAFLSGRIDLVQAEAVLAVIDANDHQHLQIALRQLAGGISKGLVRVRRELVELLADLEAGLDFVDEDIEFVGRHDVCRRLAAAEAEIGELLIQCQSRGQSTGRRRIVLAGLPNAGKSTLFNALLRCEAALVSDAAGTTRDYLRGEADWLGQAVELLDTPGWQAERDAIMQEAHLLGQSQSEAAELIVWCSACDQTSADRDRESRALAELRRDDLPLVFVRTKADLFEQSTATDGLLVSAFSGNGLADLVTQCVAALSGRQARANDLVGATAARCHESLFHSRESLARARSCVETRSGDELIALEIRDALEHLGRIVGTVYTDDILDRIFSRFCIGK